MTFADPLRSKAPVTWLFRSLGWLVTGIGFLFRAALIGSTALAIYYSNLPWASLRLVLSVAFMAFGIWALGLTRRPRVSLVFAGLFLTVLIINRRIAGQTLDERSAAHRFCRFALRGFTAGLV